MMAMKPTAGFPFMFPEQSMLRQTRVWQAVKWKLTARESHPGRSGKLFRTRMLSKESMDKQPPHIKREKDKAGDEGHPKGVNRVVWPKAPTRARSISRAQNPDHFQRTHRLPGGLVARPATGNKSLPLFNLLSRWGKTWAQMFYGFASQVSRGRHSHCKQSCAKHKNWLCPNQCNISNKMSVTKVINFSTYTRSFNNNNPILLICPSILAKN